MSKLENVNIKSEQLLITPQHLKLMLPVPADTADRVQRAREAVKAILRRDDPRLLVIVGPCSIHDPKAALEYAARLAKLVRELDDSLLLVMRAYFEKPRTTVGWKGLINDPHLDDTFEIAEGLEIARRLLLDIAEMDLPLSTEALDPIT
ncbi:MAG TPA: 3-deoxy-7-phosphoheptulonate synthase, partial [Gammaproteobacteria bacterium]